MCGSLFFMRVRILPITSAARLPSLTILVTAAPASSRFGPAAPSHRRHALPFVTTAARGWFTSWAMEAASSPIVVTRDMWKSCVCAACKFCSARLRSVISPADGGENERTSAAFFRDNENVLPHGNRCACCEMSEECFALPAAIPENSRQHCVFHLFPVGLRHIIEESGSSYLIGSGKSDQRASRCIDKLCLPVK